MTGFRAARLAAISLWLAVVVVFAYTNRAGAFPVRNLEVALAGFAAFTLVYAWHWMRAVASPRVRYPLATVTGMALLALMVTVGSALDLAAMFVFVAVAAGVSLPWGRGLVMTVILTGLVVGAGWQATGDALSLARIAALVAAAGLVAVILRVIVTTHGQLRLAREEVARLELAGAVAQAALSIAERIPSEPPPAPQPADLAGAVLAARQRLEAAGVSCRTEVSGGELPASVDQVMAAAVREGSTNVLRHAGARQCTIRVQRRGDTAMLEVLDDGRGTTPAIVPESKIVQRGVERELVMGNGLRGIQAWIGPLGGRMVAGPTSGWGFRLAVMIPLGQTSLESRSS